MNYAEAILTLV